MADFVAVIRKAVDNLAENTPENRARVYDKARAAIRRQLEAINPQPADEVIARQLEKLDHAIEEVESEHAEALPADQDETDALMAELESMVENSPIVADPAGPPATPPLAPPPATPTAASRPPAAAAPRPESQAPAQTAPVFVPPAPEPAAMPGAAPGHRPDELSGQAHDDAFGLGPDSEASDASRRSERQSGSGKGAVLAVVLLLALAGIGYAGWTYKDTFMAMIGSSQTDAPEVAQTDEPADPATETEIAAVEPETAEPEAIAPDAPEVPDPNALVDPDAGDKFTQRLGPDGTETDPGPAPGPAPADNIEGRSVAELSDTTPADESVAEESTADATVPPAEAAAPDSQALGVAQKMILYEERLGQQALEVKNGSVVWTLVSEPSGDGPDEQVIRGEINNPDTGLSALMTIKKNTDPSLPASHLIEIVFALPPEFDGGSIDQLQRISFKQTEADQGSPLIAVPAKITQDFYMVALNDLEEARQANTQLMRDRNWIDIPVVYGNGRQALITLEKGATGTEVFSQALNAWEQSAPQN
ncbi:MAG: hypothetical protein RIA09_07180 [Hoeflea sp.]|uniref:hypothetical protein n=1 Tax=Hoeflea sp. TaxID=1940281 RepID=UPI0032EE75EE